MINFTSRFFIIDMNITFCYTVHMSTGKINIAQHRFAKLASMGEIVFHIDDLANLWQIFNPNTLHTTLKRYVQQGLLFRVYRGFYAIKPTNKIDAFLLGQKALHGYSYVSTETILAQEGIIQQKMNYITFVSSKSLKFSIGENNYKSRQLNENYLYNDCEIIKKDGIMIATLERAVADLLYFNPKAHLDGANFINWKKVNEIQKKIGYPTIKRLTNKKI